MLLRLYKTNQPYLILLIPLTGLMLWLNGFINCSGEYLNEISVRMPLYDFVSPYVNYNCYLSKILALVMAIAQAFYLSKLNKDFIFIKQRTFLHALVFLMILSSSYFTQYAIPALFANFFVLFSIDWMFSSYKRNKPNVELFNAGLFISIAGLFYFSAFFLIIPILFVYIILHTFKLKELLVIITGFITPIFLTIGILYLMDDISIYEQSILEYVKNSQYDFKMEISLYVFYAYLLFLLVISFFNIIRVYVRKKISSRVFMSSLFVMFFSILFLYIILPFIGQDIIVIAAVPIAYIITDSYVNSKNSFIQELSFALLLLTLIYAQLDFQFF